MNPILRFNDFESDYVNGCINDATASLSSGVSVNSYDISVESSEEYGVLKTSCISNGVFNSSENKKIIDSDIKRAKNSVKKNTIIVSRMNTPALVGEIGYIDKSYANLFVPDRLWVLSCNQESDAKWLTYCLVSQRVKAAIKNRATGTSASMKNISKPSFLNVKISFPSQLIEQQKIADFLSSVDKKIALLKEKHDLLAQYKKGVMQKLFSQEIRFKDEAGKNFPDWSNTKFGKVFERVTQKNKEDNQNVLTISAQRGLINQKKYFNKSVSAKDVTGYYLLNNGDFAYNKSYSKGYPMGAIKRLNNYDKGVVSTLYICFKSHGNQHDAFWEQYFEAGLLNREISKIAQEGARNHGLLNVSVTEFFKDITVLEPSEKEQIRIAEFLGTLDKKLNLVSEQIEHTQTFKKGLLQQMFV